MVDAGCGCGFWGFIAKRRINSLSYVVGLVLDYEMSFQYKLLYNILTWSKSSCNQESKDTYEIF